MISTYESKSPAIFSAESIRAMSPLGKEIASMLEKAGYIKITEPAASGVRLHDR